MNHNNPKGRWMNLNGLINFLESLKFNQGTPSLGACCFTISAKKISVTYSLPEAEGLKPQLQFVDIISFEDIKTVPILLKDIVNKYNLENTNCSYVLQPQDYQILTIEALPVSGAELHAALRWRVKELIDYPVDQAIFDSFPVPLIGAGERKMMFVVAARLTKLTSIVDDMSKLGLNLKIIDIPELALRNISALYEEDGSSSALILLHPHDSQLIITKDKSLYMSRRFSYNINFANEDLSNLKDNKILDRLILEIQRSFDYFQSQMRQLPPARCLLSVPGERVEEVTNFIQERLGIKTEALDLNKLLKTKNILTPEQQIEGIVVIGEALRSEEPANVAAN